VDSDDVLIGDRGDDCSPDDGVGAKRRLEQLEVREHRSS
jgi:hypothetical protein